MAKEFDCDFYITRFSDGRDKNIEAYDYTKLKNFKGEVLLKHLFWKFNWNTAINRLFSLPYDIYIVGGPWDLSSWWLLFLSMFSRKVVYSWSHGMYGRESGIRFLIKRLFFKWCKKCIVYNERSRDLMIEAGVKPDRVFYVHNSLDHDSQLLFRDNFSDIYNVHFCNNNPTLFFIGRLIENKQLDMIITAMSILKGQGMSINFVFIGDGPQKTRLQESTHNLGLQDFVWFFGACYDEKTKSELITNADLCVTPGSIGLTCIDSMTYGTPVITKDDLNHQGPEYAAIKQGETGLFFAAGDVNDLAEKIKQWLSNGKDRQVIRQACYNEIDSYWTPQYEIDQFKILLQNS